MQCLVLAGGTPRLGEPLYEETRGRAKAELDLGGKPMVQWVLDALAASEVIEGVVLVGLPTGCPAAFPGLLERLPSQGTLAQNLYAGIDRLLTLEPAVRRAAYCWSDIPLATGPMIRRFVERARETAPDADVVAGLVRREDVEGRYPSVRERWLRVRRERFVAADFGVFDPKGAEAVRRPLETLTDRRKSALRQASAVGVGLMVRYVLGRVSLPGLERTLEKRYGVRPRVLIVDDPELGLDVDGLENLAVCRHEIGSRLAAG